MTQHQPLPELSISPVNTDSPVPLYFQVELDLKRLIESGALPVGAIVPPEQDLCRLYGVSRHTMRTALSRLVSADLISRSAGRGTFVKPQANRATFYLDRSFTRQMADMGRQTRSEVLEVATGIVEESHAELLRVRSGAACLTLIRLRFGDEEPIGIQYTTLLTDRCPGVDQFDWSERSLYEILANHYKLIITEIRHTIGAAVVDEEQARLLMVVEGDPLLTVDTAAFLDRHQIIEHTTSYYRADRYQYRTVHTLGSA